MLYLINETFYNKDTKEIIDILKIGYIYNKKENSPWKVTLHKDDLAC